MKNDNQSALDLFSNYSDFALTNDELLAIHGGATNSGGGHSDSSSSSSHAPPSAHHGGGGNTGMAVPPMVMHGADALQRGAEAVRDAGVWALEKAGDAIYKAADASGLFKTPILHDVVVPPKPQA